MLALKTAQHDYWVLINLFPTFFYFFFSITLFILYYFYPKNPLLMVGLTVDALVLTTLLYFSGGNDLQVILLFLVQVAAAYVGALQPSYFAHYFCHHAGYLSAVLSNPKKRCELRASQQRGFNGD